MNLFNPTQSVSSAVAESMLLSTKSHTGRHLVSSAVARSIAAANAVQGGCANHLVTSEHSGPSGSVPSHLLTDQEK